MGAEFDLDAGSAMSWRRKAMLVTHRRETRASTSIEALIHIEGAAFPCRVKDVSLHGAKVLCRQKPAKGAPIALLMEPFGRIKGDVAWQSSEMVGVKFTDERDAVGEVLLLMASYSMF
ncbi:MAG: PilZ domain-containing protein [Alphaproteobacteria bacterium]|nr:PilZ domain-containing protein [Alphaproteobacteria bacterium]MBF0251169.1 PilZ domain-containing protein [Alphaproteobacteria bacterium]